MILTPPPLPRPSAPGSTAPVTATTSHGINTARHVTLRLSDGTELALRGTAVIGRHPSAGDRHAHTLALPDTTRTLSRDHLEIGLTSTGQVWVADLGSANGTYVTRGHSWTRLTPHQRNPVDDHDTLRFADYSLTFGYSDEPGTAGSTSGEVGPQSPSRLSSADD